MLGPLIRSRSCEHPAGAARADDGATDVPAAEDDWRKSGGGRAAEHRRHNQRRGDAALNP